MLEISQVLNRRVGIRNVQVSSVQISNVKISSDAGPIKSMSEGLVQS